MKSSKLRRLLASKAFPLLIIFLVLEVVTIILSKGTVLKPVNILTLLYSLVIQVMMCTGLSCALISGNMDLSIAAQATLGSMLFSMLLMTSLPLWLCIVIAVAIAVAMGMLNTLLVNVFHFPSFIATIGLSSIYGGVTYLITDGYNKPITNDAVLKFGATKFGPIPLIFVIAIVLLIAFEIMLRKTNFGRYIYMCGGNPYAARLAGLNPDKTRMVMFLINSILSVGGGIFYAAQTTTAHPTAITQAAPNMTATAAAILGGVSFFGGTGTLLGPLVGLFLINALKNMFQILDLNTYWNVVCQGVLLLLALFIDYVNIKRKEDAMVKAALSK